MLTSSRTSRIPLSLLGFIAAFCLIARADTIEINLSSLVNADLTTYTGGFNYPQHGGPLTVDGVPFVLATENSDTAVIQTPTAAGDSETFTIPVGVFGVTSVDALINSAFGSCGANVGSLEFVGSSGAPFTVTLTEGKNVRDHFNGNFCNSRSQSNGSAEFGSGADRLDRIAIDLPAAFATETLTSIDFSGFGQGLDGAPFLAAATVVTATSAIPEPGALPLAALAFGLVLLIRRS